MIISGHLNFFGVQACGLYTRETDAPKALDVAETFGLIYKWVQGKPMEDTIPWDPESSRHGAPKCYCHDFFQCEETGEYLFVLWKSDTDGAGTLWGAQASARTGEGAVVEYTDSYKGKTVIWGRPCYYWVIPALRTVVSVKLEHSVCDSQMFQDWVSKCIVNRIPHPNKKKSETVTGQIRFEYIDGSDQSGGRYSYKFDMGLRSLDTSSAELRELASRVTHIVRRDTIKLNVGTEDRSEWIKFFDKIPRLPVKPKAKTRQIEVKAEAKPSAAEIKKIIEDFSKAERKRSDWNNVGFATDTGVVWIDKYRLHETINFSQEVPGVLAASDIHSRLAKERDRLLSGIKKEELAKRSKKRTAAGG